MHVNLILAVVAILAIIYYIWDYTKYVYVRSHIDNRMYKVKRNRVSQESANMLALINQRILILIEHVNSLPSKPEYSNRLGMYNPSNISENVWNIDTTYTLNKGESMFFCMGPRDNTLRIYDINTLMYVAIHELAHISSVSIGHTDEFKKNFKELIDFSMVCKVYEYVDYSKAPVDYCGIEIKSNITSKFL